MGEVLCRHRQGLNVYVSDLEGVRHSVGGGGWIYMVGSHTDGDDIPGDVLRVGIRGLEDEAARLVGGLGVLLDEDPGQATGFRAVQEDFPGGGFRRKKGRRLGCLGCLLSHWLTGTDGG